MRYRPTLSSSPRVLLLFVITLALAGAALGLFFLMGVLLGVIGLVIALYLGYHLVRFAVGHLRSHVTTDAEGLHCLTIMGEDLAFSWRGITVSGKFHRKREKPSLFVYNEEEDRFLKIPPEYRDIEALEGELREKTAFVELTLDEDETLEDRLNKLYP